MDRSKRNVRLEAAKAFMASLDQLGDVLSSNVEVEARSASQEIAKDNTNLNSAPSHSSPSSTSELDAFEQAVAELEAYIEGQSAHS